MIRDKFLCYINFRPEEYHSKPDFMYQLSVSKCYTVFINVN